MQDEASQQATCRTCKAEPGRPCVGEGGTVLERVHWGRPHAADPIEEDAAARYCHTCGQPYVGECQSTELHRKIEHFRNTPRPMVTAEQWAATHIGNCTLCGKPARLYPEGWRCTDHPPVGTATIGPLGNGESFTYEHTETLT